MMQGAISREQWLTVTPPIYFVEINYSKWRDIHYEMAMKWAGEHVETWVYRDGNTFIFGSVGDRTLFRLWLSENCLDRETGEIL